jgi:SAM-dependent methyltransferase
MLTINLCPACAEYRSDIVASLDAQNASRFAQYDDLKYGGLLSKWTESIPPVVSRCRVCGHCWYLNQPEPQQLSIMYAEAKPLTSGLRVSREASQYMRQEMRRLTKLLRSNEKPSTLLDFGSGLGRWSRAAVLEGFSVTAYEPSLERGSEKNTPFELVHSIDELKNRKFDAIQLEQVLEHVPDPIVTLKKLHELCKPHTVIRITVPNLLRDQDGEKVWSTWPFDGRTPHFLAPFEHLHGFTPKSLDTLLKRAGFKNIGIKNEAKSAGANLLRRLIGRYHPILNSTLRYVQTLN